MATFFQKKPHHVHGFSSISVISLCSLCSFILNVILLTPQHFSILVLRKMHIYASCGFWKFEELKGWGFVVDKDKGGRAIVVESTSCFAELRIMAYEDFGIDQNLVEIVLSYLPMELINTIDCPPVIIGNDSHHCSCYILAKNAELLGSGTFVGPCLTHCISWALVNTICCFATNGVLLGLPGCFVSCYACGYRRTLRAKYNLEEAPCGDFVTHFFCHLCAICQEYREIRERSSGSNPPDVKIAVTDAPLAQTMESTN